MLAAAFAAIALLPGVLTDTVTEVKQQTPIPILLPDSLPTDTEEVYPYGGGSAKEYALGVSSAPDCGGATACFEASFTAEHGGKPFGRGKVTLAKGRHGRYQPLGCGASCSPPSISWSERGVTYAIQARVVGKGSDRSLLVKMANQAIRRGPR